MFDGFVLLFFYFWKSVRFQIKHCFLRSHKTKPNEIKSWISLKGIGETRKLWTCEHVTIKSIYQIHSRKNAIQVPIIRGGLVHGENNEVEILLCVIWLFLFHLYLLLLLFFGFFFLLCCSCSLFYIYVKCAVKLPLFFSFKYCLHSDKYWFTNVQFWF